MSTIFDPNQTPSASMGYQNISNILDNGGFEVWQRGITFTTPANNAYTTDRWKVSYNNTPTFTVSQESTTIDSGQYSLKLNITAVGSAQYLFFNQAIENYQAYRGKTITVSIRINSNVSGIYLAVSDTAATYSSLYSTPGSWQTLTVTRTVGAGATTLNVTVGFDSTVAGQPAPSISTTYFDSAMFVVGSTVIPFVPTNLEVDLARCQRLFVRIGGNNGGGEFLASGMNQSTTATYYPIRLPVQMRIAPTVTISGQTGFDVYNATGSGVPTTTLSSGIATVQSLTIVANVAAGMVAGNGNILISASTSSYIDVSADL